MSNFWNQDEEEFRDVPDEVSEKEAPPASLPPQQRRALPAVQHQVQEPEEFEIPDIEMEDDNDDYESVLSDARLRLEQGRLYEMIMNHPLFDGVDADPTAVKSVQKQIRKFAKEQMEIMLGMRRETAKIEHLEIDFPFNSVEVTVLKKLAFAASKGASENSDRFVPEVKKTVEEVPVVTAQPRKEGLNPIGSQKKPAPKPQVRQVQPTPKAPPAKLPTQPSRPVQRKPPTAAASKILVEEGVTQAQIDAQYDAKPLEKPIHEMTEDELIARNAEISNRRHRTVKNPSALPMPSFEQENLLHQTRLIESPQTTNAVSLIMAALNKNVK
jgi:hypothetical protein